MSELRGGFKSCRWPIVIHPAEHRPLVPSPQQLPLPTSPHGARHCVAFFVDGRIGSMGPRSDNRGYVEHTEAVRHHTIRFNGSTVG
jgi:hypothetical protein